MQLKYYNGEEVKVGDKVSSSVYPTEVETTMEFGYHEIDFDSGGCAKCWGFYLKAYSDFGLTFDSISEVVLDKQIVLIERAS